MIDREHKLSVVRQARLLGFSRGSVYCERDEQPTAFGVDGIAIALSFRTSVLPASA